MDAAHCRSEYARWVCACWFYHIYFLSEEQVVVDETTAVQYLEGYSCIP